jgi:NAD(P)H-hydrate epimerase
MNNAENSIITPHSKELEYFLINSKVNETIIRDINNEKNIIKKSKLIKKITQKFLNKNNIILLKGKIDIIISKDKVFFNKTGNAGMTKGGTGDVLAGLCAGFL